MSSPNSVSYEIADVIRNDILRGQYRVGERLPSERDLAGSFRVSRGVVREALSQLDQQGIIDTQPGGARVKPLEKATLAILGPLMALEEVPDPELVDQFLEIFSVLTVLTAKAALRRARTEQMNRLEQLLVELGEVAEDPEAMQPKIQELLDYMSSIANNLVVRLIGNDVKAQVVERMLSLGIKPRLERGAGLQLVKELDSAFRQRDGLAAASAFERHFEKLRVAVRESLEMLRDGYRQQAV